MRPTDIFRKLMSQVYLSTAFFRKRKCDVPGGLVAQLSPEERAALSNLTSDDLSEEKISLDEAKLLAMDEHYEKQRLDAEFRNEKLQFDKLMKK